MKINVIIGPSLEMFELENLLMRYTLLVHLISKRFLSFFKFKSLTDLNGARANVSQPSKLKTDLNIGLR